MTLVSEFAVIEQPEDVNAILQGQKNYQTFEYDMERKLAMGIIDTKEIQRATGKENISILHRG
jgi:hypothetical protein